MSFFALLIAFLAEQLRPLPVDHPVHRAVRSLADRTTRSLEEGGESSALLGWALVVVLPTLVVWMLSGLLGAIHPVFELVLHVVVLWLTLGFRQFSHHFTEMQFALARGDTALARGHLEAWMRQRDPAFSASALTVPGMCRVAIEAGVVDAHRRVFGVLFWYVLLPGPCGAVLYRLAVMMRDYWAPRTDAFGSVSRRAFDLLDWIPARLTALSFAVVGNFDDALYGWRQRAGDWADRQRGIVVEAAAGALGVRLAPRGSEDLSMPVNDLGEPLGAGQGPAVDGQHAAGTEPDARLPQVATLQAAVSLLWRATVLCLVVLFVASMVFWIG